MSRRGNIKKLRETALTAEDLQKYADGQSDFAFEMEILQLVKQRCGAHTRWGGLYLDPNTQKHREYDIQAELSIDRNHWCYLAIECKHLTDHFPLVVSCTPRVDSEQTVDYWHWVPEKEPTQVIGPGGFPVIRSLPEDVAHYGRYNSCPNMFYSINDYVGRSIDQVGIDKDTESIAKEDKETFDKWSQALSSLYGMLMDAQTYQDAEDRENIVFLPIVVVPDKTLWQIMYSSEGQQIGSPQRVDSIAYWVGISYNVRGGSIPAEYFISHLHFVTETGLKNLLTDKDRLWDAFHSY